MAVLDTQKPPLDPAGPDRRAVKVGPIGRLGHYTATHFRAVLIGWLVIAVVLGFFAPRVETALSGAGWETTGSQSVQARQLIDKNFKGLSSYGLMTVLYSPTKTVSNPSFQAAVANVERTLRADGAVSTVIPPAAGVSISRDGHTAIVQAGAARDSNAMVVAADRLKGKLAALSAGGVQVHLTGASAMWSDFNAANRSAMLKSEVISWPVTLLILLVAFGSLVAAGLPLMLTMVGLMAAAGSLYLGTQVMPISIWAMNFALMFALALGIDYALFVVHRFRGAFFGSKLSAEEATAVTMDTAGKAVLFSGVTVLISLSAVMLVPSPAFRSMSLGIMLAVHLRARRDADAAARRAREARTEGRQALAAVGALRRAPLGEVRRVGRATVEAAARLRGDRARDPRRPGDPRHAAEDLDAVDQGRPDLRQLTDRLPAGAGRVRTRPDRPAADRGISSGSPRRHSDRTAATRGRGA